MPDSDTAVLERPARQGEAQRSPVHQQQYTDRTAEVPAVAMQFAAELNFGDNGDGAKSVPVRILARSPGEAFHWYWGRIVHDLDGMKLHKQRIPIDYLHAAEDVLGYVNKFDVTDEGLILGGALVPFKESDRAQEVIHKARAGVPYEASIGSSWDGMIIEEVPAGSNAEANGLTFAGPITIFRKWHLRGVAICPYGADMNTASEFKLSRDNENSSTVPVTFTTTGKTQEKTKMADESKDDQDQKTAESPEDVEAEEKAAESTEGVEAETDENKPAESPEGVEADEKAAESTEDVDAGDMSAGRVECQKFIEAFGEKGGQWFAEGKTFAQAQELNVAELKAENDKLKSRLAAAGEGETEPVEFQPGEDGKDGGDGKPGKLAGTIGEGLARFASGLKLPQNANKD